MIKKSDRRKILKHKHKSVRKRIQGTAERPRMAVFRSLNHIYAQVINDDLGITLAAASSLDAEFKAAELSGGNVEGAKKVGELIAKKVLDKGITKVVYDRGGSLYHGRVAALAEAAREAGLDF
ncbi:MULTISPECIES: 50S ribosomal protein L18 [Dehalobacter]|uniref:Large ribosomal subunit protein uL18 n=2 Tax=Dehalobacter restrictus TaxID=55583 RepID=A0A857DGK0_9FIRM|nr:MULTISPECIES: 50S ribosomal protein L18 [Dehalobacter]AHF09120.1 50S ribosomal protein L18 [Dehalobacter restrictus DSM 9455]MCG1024425.1 50S ribosomal protein L18 [Dehalobacter sp.]MDJ0306859.1 50S ribosomal protein L18 [Dehalobacter sp.]OCZ53733.1 50S ribosomal protein L18 [Dehalobacter sp. TeCB1]QGZ99658.1 50S ribosomal protein L18 [Dehalobacter restrictus]